MQQLQGRLASRTTQRARFVALTTLVVSIALGGLTGCGEAHAAGHRVLLMNESGATLVPYVVVGGVRVSEETRFESGSTRMIDITDFNQVFHDPASATPDQPNTLYVQTYFNEETGGELLTRASYNAVPPGQEGADPALAPVILADTYQEVPAGVLSVRIRVDPALSVAYELK